MKVSFLPQILTIFLFSVYLNGVSQNNDIRITSERNNDQSVDFFFSKDDLGSFYLSVTFNHLENASPTSFKGVITGMQGKFLSIKPINPNAGIGYSYQCSWIRGVLNPRIDTSFVYLLPVSKGKSILALENTNLFSDFLGSEKPKNWKAFQFNVNPGDTVFSARKGLVVDVIDGNQANPNMSYSFSSKSNSIIIEQEDGTLACYSVLKNGSMMVKSGQIVYPHTPLALAGTFDIEKNTQIRFYVYYLTNNNLEKPDKMTLGKITNYYAFVNPLFYTTEGNRHLSTMQEYTADYTAEHIQKELTKREKKKLAK